MNNKDREDDHDGNEHAHTETTGHHSMERTEMQEGIDASDEIRGQVQEQLPDSNAVGRHSGGRATTRVGDYASPSQKSLNNTMSTLQEDHGPGPQVSRMKVNQLIHMLDMKGRQQVQ